MKPFAALRPPERTIARIPLGHIRTSSYQPRRMFSEQSLQELAESIRQHGLLTPLLVRRVNAEQYELIAGERRLRALMLLKRTHADAVVLSAYDEDCALIALVENLQRENLHYLDEAEACRAILDERGLTQEKLAQSLSVSPSALANRLRLLKLAPEVREMLRKSPLGERHARALLRLSDPMQQLELIREAAQHPMSVKQMEAKIDRMIHAVPAHPKVSRIIRDHRIIINAVLDTVKELNRIGVRADSRVEEHPDSITVTVTIPVSEHSTETT